MASYVHGLHPMLPHRMIFLRLEVGAYLLVWIGWRIILQSVASLRDLHDCAPTQSAIERCKKNPPVVNGVALPPKYCPTYVSQTCDNALNGLVMDCNSWVQAEFFNCLWDAAPIPGGVFDETGECVNTG